MFGYNLNTWFIYNTFLIKNCYLAKYIETGEPLIDNGIILANHISITDGGIDNVINNTHGICRSFYMLIMLFNGIICLIENWGICINRENCRGEDLVRLIKVKLSSVSRVLLYPEGTRKKYYDSPSLITKKMIKENLKYGTLVYLYSVLPNTPIQVSISLNKDKVFTNWSCTIVPFYRSKPIIPSDYENVDEFLEVIIDTFYCSIQECIKKR